MGYNSCLLFSSVYLPNSCPHLAFFRKAMQSPAVRVRQPPRRPLAGPGRRGHNKKDKKKERKKLNLPTTFGPFSINGPTTPPPFTTKVTDEAKIPS